MSIFSKMTAIADEIRSLTGDTEPLTLDDMSSNLGEVNLEVSGQTDLIAQITAALEGKAAGGGIDTSDATATANDILIGKTAYVNGELITGSYDGVELNFDIIGGTSEPENPTENMIWINTDVKITGWEFSSTEPINPSNNMIWIIIGTSSLVEFNSLKENSVKAYPVSAKQYVNGAWVNKTAKSYQNNTWVDWVQYIYNGGLITGFAGGLNSSSYSWDSASQIFTDAVFNSDHISCTGITGVQLGGVGTINAVNLTQYKTLYVDAKFSAVHSDNGVRLTTTKTALRHNTAALFSCSTTDRQIISVDVSNYSQSMYITVTATLDYNVKIYNIWLE